MSEQGGRIGFDGRRPFTLTDLSQQGGGGTRKFERLEDWTPPGAAPLRLVELIEMELSSDHERIDRLGVLERLAELIIFTLVRHMTEKEAAIRESLPMALKDSRIWRALSTFNQAPAAHWTVDKLARVAGMSRTALAVRFHELIGEPPLQCLTRLRMDMATDMLLRDDAPVKSIAERVGYGTEAAFNRAFVRQLGTSPGRWRTDRRNALG